MYRSVTRRRRASEENSRRRPSRALAESARAVSGCSNTSMTCPAPPRTSPAAKRKPAEPAWRMSVEPVIRVATAGSPMARASAVTYPKDSNSEVLRNTSAAAKNGRTSGCHPRTRKACSTPSSRANRRVGSLSGPSSPNQIPTTSGKRFWTVARILTKVWGSF